MKLRGTFSLLKRSRVVPVFFAADDKYIHQEISFLSDFEIKEFNNIKETLEDYFMKFYKEEKDFGGALK